MKDPLALYREHPHIVVQGPRRNWRRPLVLSNEPVGPTFALEDDVFVAPGMVDADGAVTERGRQIIRRRLAARARGSKGRTCIVWSATSCTWIDSDGRLTEGVLPPQGDMTNPWTAQRQPVRLENCHTIRLPEGSDASYLCVQRLGHGLVEISPGERVVLADMDVPHDPGLPDPAASMLRGRARLRAPETYRDVRVTGTAGWRILGPVQPLDGGRLLRNPWPDDVRDACTAIAGIALPARMTDAAWRAVDPQQPEMNFVGVLKAA